MTLIGASRQQPASPDHGLRVDQADKPVFVEALVANFPLKLSTWAFSIGFPGRMKRRVTP